MGQYHIVCNLDRHEFLVPHALGDGLKLAEFGWSAGGTMTALAILLAASNGRGGGDIRVTSPFIGSWAGERVVIVGDYAQSTDYEWGPDDDDPATVYRRCMSDDPVERDPSYVNISDEMRDLIQSTGRVWFDGSGWLTRHWAGEEDEHATSLVPDMVFQVHT